MERILGGSMTDLTCAPDEITVQPVFEAKVGQVTGLVGIVATKGLEIHDVHPGDYVIAGQIQSETRRTTFHFYDYVPLAAGSVQAESALIAPGAALLHAVHVSGLRFGESALRVGTGFAAGWLQQILPGFGIACGDPAGTSETESIDAIFICSPKHSALDLKIALRRLRPGGLVVSLSRWAINTYWHELFKKQVRMIFPDGFGPTLQHRENQTAFQLPREYVFRTAKKNLADFARIFNSDQKQSAIYDPKEVIFRSY